MPQLPYRQDAILDLLAGNVGVPLRAVDIAAELCVTVGAARRAVNALRAARKAYVADWCRLRRGHPAPMYEIGPGTDAPRALTRARARRAGVAPPPREREAMRLPARPATWLAGLDT